MLSRCRKPADRREQQISELTRRLERSEADYALVNDDADERQHTPDREQRHSEPEVRELPENLVERLAKARGHQFAPAFVRRQPRSRKTMIQMLAS